MAQVLKEEIRERILNSAREEFYRNGFSRSTMREIAKGAGIPAGLIYSYYDSKEVLFDEVLRPVRYDWKEMLAAEKETNEMNLNRLSRGEFDCLKNLLNHRKEFIIMIDRSAGTVYESEKENFIREIELHVSEIRKRYPGYDPVYIHIIVDNFVEGLLQIMYHYQNDGWALETLKKLTKMYLLGIDL